MSGYNLPNNVDLWDETAPWNQKGEPIQDENAIRQAREEVTELITSLAYLDRNLKEGSHFPGWGKALGEILEKLNEMLGEL